MGADGEGLTPRPEQVPLILRRLDDGPLATLIRLFMLGLAVPRAAASRALRPLSVASAAHLGVVRLEDDHVRAEARLIPGADLVFACDLEPASAGEQRPDHVMGVTPSSRLLSTLTIRHAVADETQEKAGLLEFLSPTQADTLAHIHLFNLGIFKLSDQTRESAADTIARKVAELYCERMEFHLGAVESGPGGPPVCALCVKNP